MKTINLTQGYSAKVDLPDFNLLSKYKWHYANGYAYTKVNNKHISMHEMIMGRNWIDHANLDRLDNRRSNLRPTNYSLNRANSLKNKNQKLYKGVTKKNNKWQVYLRGKYLGVYNSPKEAGMIYDQHARQLFGEYYRGNEL